MAAFYGAGETPGGPAVKKRDRWRSEWVFTLAAISCAVGASNVLRFPYLVFIHGGGTFLLPYTVFIFTVGCPLVLTELGLGRLFQRGDVEAFGGVHPRARGAGAISALGGFMISTYYTHYIAWALYLAAMSFQWPLPWAAEDCGSDSACLADPERALPVPAMQRYFDYTMLTTNERSIEDGIMRGFSWRILISLTLTWLLIFFGVWKGVRSLTWSICFTVFTPFTLILAFTGYNMSLEGAWEGMRAYTFTWDWIALSHGSTWSDAAGEMFFAIGGTLGMLTAYASYCPSSADMYAANVRLTVVDTAVSFVAGLGIFSLMGNLVTRYHGILEATPALRHNMCLAAAEAGDCSPDFECTSCMEVGAGDWAVWGKCCGNVGLDHFAVGMLPLAFTVYPAALQYLGWGVANIMSIIWFVTIAALGIGTMQGAYEGFTTVLDDTGQLAHFSRKCVTAVTCTIGYLLSLVFMTDVGIPLLKGYNHYIVHFGLTVAGALEVYVVAWVWAWPEMTGLLGKTSAVLFIGGYTTATVVGISLAAALHNVVPSPVNALLGIAMGVLIFAIAAALSFATRRERCMSPAQWAGIASLAGTRNLRSTFKLNPAPWEVVLHIATFDIPAKYACVPTLLGLFVNQAVPDSNSSEGFEDYPDWVHFISGVLVLGVLIFSLVVFVVYPGFLDAVAGKLSKEEVVPGRGGGPRLCALVSAFEDSAYAGSSVASRDHDSSRMAAVANVSMVDGFIVAPLTSATSCGRGLVQRNKYVPVLPRDDGWANDPPIRLHPHDLPYVTYPPRVRPCPSPTSHA